MGGKHEAGQKEGKAGSMYFLKASSKQQRNKDQGISGLPTQNSELVSARRPAGNPGTGVVQAADRKATAKLREQPLKVERQGVPLSLQWKAKVGSRNRKGAGDAV